MLSTIDVELKLVIAGNHDFSLDHVYGQILDPDHTDDDDDDDEVDEEDTDKYDHEQAMALFKGPLAKEVSSISRCYSQNRAVRSILIIRATGRCYILV